MRAIFDQAMMTHESHVVIVHADQPHVEPNGRSIGANSVGAEGSDSAQQRLRVFILDVIEFAAGKNHKPVASDEFSRADFQGFRERSIHGSESSVAADPCDAALHMLDRYVFRIKFVI
jgi:hypothetical protein